MWVVTSRDNINRLTTIYGPFDTFEEADKWCNAVADPNTKGTTDNFCQAVHKPDRIISN